MKSYILLRDRVETKAMSLEELHAMGLRPTDRIWVECQSWDWERPEQVAELKMLLDGQTPQINSTPAQSPAIPKEPVKKTSSAIAGQQTVPGKKPAVLHIKKTILPDPISTIAAQQPMPGEEPELIVEQKKVLPLPEAEADMYKYGGISSVVAAMREDSGSNADNNAAVTVNDNPPTTVNGYAGIKSQQDSPALETNYTRSLDEIKELYVKNLAEQGRLRKIKKWGPKELKKVAVYIGFAAAGALIMVLVTNSGNKKTTTTLPVTQQPVASLTQPINNTQDPVDPQAIEPANTVATVENIRPEETVPDRLDEKRSTEPVKPANPEKRSVVVPDEKEKEPVTKTVVEEPGLKKIDNRSTISSQVSLKANDYTTGSFGGIRNLEMTVQNNSKYLLDEVMVELKYLNLDGILVHTDHIVFRSIQAGQPETMAVKKSRRGMKVKYRVTKIESKEADNSMAGF